MPHDTIQIDDFVEMKEACFPSAVMNATTPMWVARQGAVGIVRDIQHESYGDYLKIEFLDGVITFISAALVKRIDA